MTDRPTVTPSRLHAHIDVALCMEPMCYAAIAVEQTETHARWHAERRARTASDR